MPIAKQSAAIELTTTLSTQFPPDPQKKRLYIIPRIIKNSEYFINLNIFDLLELFNLLTLLRKESWAYQIGSYRVQQSYRSYS